MKKKLFAIALLFTMVFAFAACGTTQADYLPDYGEQGYVANLYRGLWYTNDKAPKEAIITSTQELKEFCDAVQFEDSVLSGNNRETVQSRFIKRLDSYSDKYFKENTLTVILHAASSGSYVYTMKSVTAQNNILNVTIQEALPGDTASHDQQIWGILIEYPKGDYTQLKVDIVWSGENNS